jgi:hypothetical protein
VGCQVLLTLLERISLNESLKDDISREGGIQAIVDIGIYQFIAHEDVVARCLGYEPVARDVPLYRFEPVAAHHSRPCTSPQHPSQSGLQLEGGHQHDHATQWREGHGACDAGVCAGAAPIHVPASVT